MSNQAGGDAGNQWQRQLFVGQIPLDWDAGRLRDYLSKHLAISEDRSREEIEINDNNSNNNKANNQKRIAFIRFKNEHYHEKALKKDTFNRAEIKLNIKLSNHENDKRKLFFGRLSLEWNMEDMKDKVREMISRVCPGYEEHIDDDFPQVPNLNQESKKSRIAFVQFKTHEQAREVRERFQKLAEEKNPDLLDKLAEFSQTGKGEDLAKAVDYHKRESTKGKFLTGPETEQHHQPQGWSTTISHQGNKLEFRHEFDPSDKCMYLKFVVPDKMRLSEFTHNLPYGSQGSVGYMKVKCKDGLENTFAIVPAHMHPHSHPHPPIIAQAHHQQFVHQRGHQRISRPTPPSASRGLSSSHSESSVLHSSKK